MAKQAQATTVAALKCIGNLNEQRFATKTTLTNCIFNDFHPGYLRHVKMLIQSLTL